MSCGGGMDCGDGRDENVRREVGDDRVTSETSGDHTSGVSSDHTINDHTINDHTINVHTITNHTIHWTVDGCFHVDWTEVRVKRPFHVDSRLSLPFLAGETRGGEGDARVER